jgi:DNA-binding NarL/FixJ family response regulator
MSLTTAAYRTGEPVRIIVGDDHPLVQAALKAVLGPALPFSEIIPCYTLDEVISRIEAQSEEIDLVLLDMIMPGMNGILGLLRLLKRFPMVPVAVISALQNPATVKQVIQAGASGFIPKSLPTPEMVEAVQKILGGDIFVPPNPDLEEDFSTYSDVNKRLATLSPQQLRVLTLIVQGKLNKQISYELKIAEQTVKVYVSTIFQRLGVKTRTQAALLVQGLIPTENGDQAG